MVSRSMSPRGSSSQDPLLNASSTRELKRRQGGHSRGIVLNRCLVLLILIFSAGTFWYFQTRLSILTARVANDETNLKSLQVVASHQAMILSHYNLSITNKQVLTQLGALGSQVNVSQQFVMMELNATQMAISQQLNATAAQLQQSVVAAQAQIQNQVQGVKGQVNQYIQKTKGQLTMQSNFMIYQLAGTFALLSCLISMWHMTSHLRHFYEPKIQRKIMAILWMVPIYAITSWLSLVFKSASGYLVIVKDFYEAYIIYQFLSFCIAVLGRGNRDTVIDLLTQHSDHLSPPFRFDAWCNRNPYSSPRELAAAVLMQCQAFAMQFVFLRPLTAIAIFVLQKLKYYGPSGNPMSYDAPQFYITAVQNISIFVAFAGLLKFYHAVDKELKWCKPFAKFLCIKGVVFMTFWQGLAISLLANTSKSRSARQQWASSAQNFLVCLEMLLFSIAHFYTYPTYEWKAGYKEQEKKKQESHFGDSLALGDFVSDIKLIMK